MEQVRVVLLSSRTLFAEGIAARLRQYLGEHELQIVDAGLSTALEKVIEAQPVAVILDGTDAEVSQQCSLGSLISALPGLKVIRLDPEKDEVQVVTSQRREAAQVKDLIAVIEPVEEPT